jgi:signal transduction histidine kinase
MGRRALVGLVTLFTAISIRASARPQPHLIRFDRGASSEFVERLATEKGFVELDATVGRTCRWVLLASLIPLVLAIVGYPFRVRQISRAMSDRFDERLAERTRLARELHDTLLQTIEASKMVADHAMKNVDDRERMTRAIEQLSSWLGRATEDGRTALHSLRVSPTENNDFAAALRRAIEECRGSSSADVSFAVHGASRRMDPVVRDEAYRVAYEAIRNACTHSGGTRIDVALRYGRDLLVRVADNGAGMDAVTTAAVHVTNANILGKSRGWWLQRTIQAVQRLMGRRPCTDWPED